MERPTTKFVTARELSRQTAALLDVVREGTRVVVTRRGFPVAVLEPTEELALIARTRSRAPVEAIEPEEEEIDLDTLGLADEAFLTLNGLALHGHNPDRIIREVGVSVDGIGLCFGRLEVAGLTTLTDRGYLLTKLGERALAAWKARD